MGGEDARLALYDAILPYVDAVDVEVNAREIAGQVIKHARAKGRLTIASYHNFTATPSLTELMALKEKGKGLGGDVVKVAAHCTCPEDVRCLAQFTLECAPTPVIAIGMGPYGTLSRIFFPVLGSLMNYTFIDTEAAPGQLNYQDTLKYLDVFYPERTRQPE